MECLICGELIDEGGGYIGPSEYVMGILKAPHDTWREDYTILDEFHRGCYSAAICAAITKNNET